MQATPRAAAAAASHAAPLPSHSLSWPSKVCIESSCSSSAGHASLVALLPFRGATLLIAAYRLCGQWAAQAASWRRGRGRACRHARGCGAQVCACSAAEELSPASPPSRCENPDVSLVSLLQPDENFLAMRGTRPILPLIGKLCCRSFRLILVIDRLPAECPRALFLSSHRHVTLAQGQVVKQPLSERPLAFPVPSLHSA